MKALYYLAAFILFTNFSSAEKQRVAVIGAGGSGITTAWLLEQDYDVTLIEKSNRLGGNAHTIDIQLPSSKGTFPIDAGFEFITKNEFPYLTRLLGLLGVSMKPFELTSTFFSSETGEGFVITPISKERFEVSSFYPPTLTKILNLKNTLDNARVFIDRLDLSDIRDLSIPLEKFMHEFGFNKNIRDQFLYPFLGAGWGASREDIKNYSAYYLFSTILTETQGASAPIWYEIIGGTGAYIRAVSEQLHRSKILLDTLITQITWSDGLYHIVTSSGEIVDFEKLVLATPLSEMQTLLKDLPEYQDLIQATNKVRYFKTNIYLHGDVSFMPRDKDDWSVVNVRSIRNGEKSGMSTYKPWHTPKEFPVFKSWIFSEDKVPEKIYAQADFYHAHLDANYCTAQTIIQKHQGRNNLYFVGVQTQEIDRHESGIRSAIRVAKNLAPHSKRLQDLLSKF